MQPALLVANTVVLFYFEELSMTSSVVLEAEVRTDLGRGASRRLRRLENKIPAVIYGGGQKAIALHLMQNKVNKVLESESIYSSVFNIKVDGKNEHVILKDLQRHPYKAMILHMDFQRVSDQDVLVKMIPLHFIHEHQAAGVKEGGIVNHAMTQVEVRCKAKDLPEFVEVDLLNLALNEVLHLSDIQLPKGVELALDLKQGDHDHPVVSIHTPRVEAVEEPEVDEEEALVSEDSAEEKETFDADASDAEPSTEV
jgi:large subunit ribosomal protein L25